MAGAGPRPAVAHLHPVAMTPGAVRSDDVVAARKLLRDVISETPVLYSRVLSETVAGPVYLKCENLQRTGSFKVRGAYFRIARLSDAERARGVVAASAGNHAQGVAFAAGLLGCTATVVMPEGAPLPKVEATRGYGAQVMLAGSCVEDAVAEALAYAERTGAVFVHPFDHPDIVAGQGTVGFEIVEQCPQVRTVIVPVGGGGLAAGVAVAIKDLDPSVSVVGVQAEAVAPYPASLAAGHPVSVRAEPTMADGIAVSRPGDVPFAIMSELVDRVVTVSEESLSRALLLCLERAKQVVEPAGQPAPPRCSSIRAISRPRLWWCCPAATSTRCCCPSCSGTASAPPAATWPSGAGSPIAPARWPSCSATSRTSARTCSRSGTSGWACGCALMRPRWSWWSRPAARRTAKR